MTNEEILLDRAKNNDAEAMFELGLNELFNNNEQSFNWFKKAYEHGNNKAAFGLTITSFELNNSSKYHWGNTVLDKFGKNYFKETKNYKLFISTLDKQNVEIGIKYEQNYKNIIIKYNDLMENKYIYNETIEEELSGLCLYCSYEEVVPVIEKIYDETKYPGALYLLGEIYAFGYCDLGINETKGIEYFEKAAQEGYGLAKSMLSKIYLGKASRYIYKAYNYYDEDYNNDKMMMGNCLIADYLIGTRVTHYDHHDQYFDGLTKLTEASQSGDEEADFILHVLNKDKLTKRMYKKGLEKEKNHFSNYLDDYYTRYFIDEEIDYEYLDEEFDE